MYNHKSLDMNFSTQRVHRHSSTNLNYVLMNISSI